MNVLFLSFISFQCLINQVTISFFLQAMSKISPMTKEYNTVPYMLNIKSQLKICF